MDEMLRLKRYRELGKVMLPDLQFEIKRGAAEVGHLASLKQRGRSKMDSRNMMMVTDKTMRKCFHYDTIYTHDFMKYDHLKKNEMRILDELIRSIIYNAHFSIVPPSGIVYSMKSIPGHLKRYLPLTSKIMISLHTAWQICDISVILIRFEHAFQYS